MNYIMVSKKVRVIGQVLYNLTTVQYEYIHIQYILYINHLSIQYIYIYTYLVSLITDGQSQYMDRKNRIMKINVLYSRAGTF